jgi:hypothetical protein
MIGCDCHSIGTLSVSHLHVDASSPQTASFCHLNGVIPGIPALLLWRNGATVRFAATAGVAGSGAGSGSGSGSGSGTGSGGGEPSNTWTGRIGASGIAALLDAVAQMPDGADVVDVDVGEW